MIDKVLDAIIEMIEERGMFGVGYYEVSQYLHADLVEVVRAMDALEQLDEIELDSNGVVMEWSENAAFFERYRAAGVQVVEI